MSQERLIQQGAFRHCKVSFGLFGASLGVYNQNVNSAHKGDPLMNQQDLFEELHGLRRSFAKLLTQMPPHAEDWQPRENMWKLWDLANHIAQIPATDTAIAREATQPEVQALEARLRATTVEGLLAAWDEGVATVEKHFGAMSHEEFETKTTKAFYGHAMPAKGWLLEIVTHTYHHRAMLHTHLKLLGKPVDMSYIYC